jgi:hypothetical protein
MKRDHLRRPLLQLSIYAALSCMLAAGSPALAQAAKPVMGKYGCTASKYNGGLAQYVPRGSFVISADGKYSYNGFEKPSSGTYAVDDKGNLKFKGGHFNGGQAEKIDRPNKFFLTFPANADNRWTCGLTEGK